MTPQQSRGTLSLPGIFGLRIAPQRPARYVSELQTLKGFGWSSRAINGSCGMRDVVFDCACAAIGQFTSSHDMCHVGGLAPGSPELVSSYSSFVCKAGIRGH
jgi:hypothetical protein